MAQLSRCSQGLGGAIAPSTDAIAAAGELQALRQPLEAGELVGVLVPADARPAIGAGSSLASGAAQPLPIPADSMAPG